MNRKSSIRFKGISRPLYTFIVFAVTAVFSGLLSGCATMSLPESKRISIDSLEPYILPDGGRIYSESIDKTVPDVDILAINSEVKTMLDNQLNNIKSTGKRIEALKDILRSRIRYDTENDSYGVKTAQETYDTGTGNCLSFSNLLVAMARYAGFKAEFQEIPTLPNWARDGDVLFFTRHIGASFEVTNADSRLLHLGGADTEQIIVINSRTSYLFTPAQLDPRTPDFNPLSAEPVSDSRAFAQYYNNIGSRHMAEGNHADAYRYFVKAIRTNPGLSFAWSNLGVLYRKNNQHGAAETCYLQGLSVTGGSRDTSVMTIMNNMANLYDITGEKEKEALYKNRLVSFRKKNPYYQYASARKAYNDNLFSESLRLFREAIRLKDDEHLFYYGLALAYLKTGDIKHAVFNFDRAIQYSWDNAKKGYYRQVRDSLISMQ